MIIVNAHRINQGEFPQLKGKEDTDFYVSLSKADGLILKMTTNARFGAKLCGFSLDSLDHPLGIIMRTTVPKKLLAIAAEVKEQGSANVTRLTVLKKWFEKPDRLSSFAIFIAKRASGRKGKSTGEAGQLFRNARALVKGSNVFRPEVSHEKAEGLYSRLHAFQNEYKGLRWGSARIIKNRNLFLVEEGLRIYLWYSNSPHEGYRLAANYCEHYDSSYWDSLNGESYIRIREIVRFMFTVEALEEIETVR